MSAELAARRTAAAAVLADFRAPMAVIGRTAGEQTSYAVWAYRLAGMLALVLEGLDADDTSAAQLAEVSKVLEAFDWDSGNGHQYALEHIDDIVNGRTR